MKSDIIEEDMKSGETSRYNISNYSSVNQVLGNL